MSAARDRREEKRSLARRRAETHTTGFQTTTLKLPEGVSFYQAEKGVALLDILSYKVGRGNPNADPGDDYYERTFFQYRKVGVEEKAYICPSMTFGEKDYIQEWRQAEAKKPNADTDKIDDLRPKERQIFLVYDRKNPDKGVQLWEMSFHTFGKLLDQRIRNSDEARGWDWFYKSDDRGLSLEITFGEGDLYKNIEAVAIDFVPRKSPLPDNIANHGICLDDLLVKIPYEELRRIFLALPQEGGSEGSGENKVEGGAGGAEDDDIPFDKGGQDGPSNGSDESKVDRKAELLDAGAANFRKGGKLANNPFKKETNEHAWWRDGWMSAMEEADNAKTKEGEKPITAESLGIGRGDDVSYKGKKHSFLRSSEDGQIVTILNSDDEPIKVPVVEISKWSDKSETPPAPAEKATDKKTKSSDKEESKQKGEGSDETPWDEGW